MRRGGGIILAGLLPATALCAQPPTPPVPAPLNPELRASVNGVRDAAHARDLRLRRFDVSVEVRGAVAETVVDAAFANPTAETLEGEFRLTLPAGAVVTGYALDIGGTMVDGVLVNRPRARAVYDARVRRRVDPGLAEVTPDNVFSTSVHPIPPGAGRRIRVRFVSPLGTDGLRLPLAVAAPLEGWSIAARQTGADNADPDRAGRGPRRVRADGARLHRHALGLGDRAVRRAPARARRDARYLGQRARDGRARPATQRRARRAGPDRGREVGHLLGSLARAAGERPVGGYDPRPPPCRADASGVGRAGRVQQQRRRAHGRHLRRRGSRVAGAAALPGGEQLCGARGRGSRGALPAVRERWPPPWTGAPLSRRRVRSMW